MRSDAVTNRQRILAAAQKVFTQSGFQASTEDVAEAAGVGIATVFRHFPTKRDLVEDVMLLSFDEIIARARGALSDPDASAALLQLIPDLVAFVAQKRVIIIDQLGGHAGEGRSERASAELYAVMDQVLRRAQATGTIRPDLDTDGLSLLIQGLGQPAVTNSELTTARQQAIRVALDGLRHD